MEGVRGCVHVLSLTYPLPLELTLIHTLSLSWSITAGSCRWDLIANDVDGKSKKECITRYKEIVAAIKAKRAE